MSDKVVEEKAPIVMTPKVITYDPAKKYTWEPEAIFVLTGKQFGLWLNTVRGIVGSREAMEMRMAMECNNTLEALMEQGVKSGVITELPKGEAPQPKS